MLAKQAQLTGSAGLTLADPYTKMGGALNEAEAKEREVQLLGVEEQLRMNAKGLVAAQLQDELKALETQKQKTDQLAKQLGMLSDEDMLKARILAGEMKRGEIKKDMPWSEFVQLPQSARNSFETMGGHVSGTPFGMGGGGGGEAEAPAAPVMHQRFDNQGRFLGMEERQPPRPPAPRYAASATGGNASQDPMAVSNAHVFAVAIAHEIATLLKLPLPVIVHSGPTSGTATVKR